ncbi:MAG: T9SS type A sorting domain-containing protein [Bacteroidota bacterium]
MKNLKNLIICLFIASTSFGQIIEYGYTNSGNRSLRKLSLSAWRVGQKDSAQSVKEFPKVLMQEGLSVFPNPTKDHIVLTINDFDPAETNSMTLIDVKGNVVMEQKVTSAHSEMDVSKLTAGIYYFNVVKNKNMLYYKLVKID